MKACAIVNARITSADAATNCCTSAAPRDRGLRYHAQPIDVRRVGYRCHTHPLRFRTVAMSVVDLPAELESEEDSLNSRALGVSLRPTSDEIATTAVENGTPIQCTPRIPTRSLKQIVQLVSNTSGEDLSRALRRIASEASRGEDVTNKSIRATALLLSDLVRLGWNLEVAQASLWLTAPRAQANPGEDLQDAKRRLRAPLLVARAAQLGDPAVRAFIRRVETPRTVNGQRVSILNLIDDGRALAAALDAVAQSPDATRDAELAKVVQPTLHLATAEDRCPFTDLPLLDVWRYFRHTWSLEYRPTPGRSLFVVVRNAARPFHPVMAIASVANAIPQLRVRDEWIGWTSDAVLARLAKDPNAWKELRPACLEALNDAREQIRATDLMAKCGRLRGEKLEQALLAIASAADAEREDELRLRQERIGKGLPVASMRTDPTTQAGDVDWKAASESSLFIRKRAKTLADILFAQRTLELSPIGDAVTAVLERDHFRRAVGIALREVRKVGLASRLLDVNVCGAVSPYRELLAGKLIALALASDEVRSFYRVKYRDQPSDIASKMAGRPIYRTPEVCALTTTSLYGVAASQYNRLRLEVDGARGPVRLQWKELGKTEGFGTVHFSEATVAALRAVSVEYRGGRNVNNVFGEGNSPRLRQVREGLEDLGLNANAFLKHSAPRIVYGLELHEGATRALLLNKLPRTKSPTFDAIASAWRRRWLSMRINNTDVLKRVAAQNAATVRAELAPPGPQLDLFVTKPTDDLTTPAATRGRLYMMKQSKVELVQTLYRNLSAMADHHDPTTVDQLHISTSVDSWVRTRAIKGQIVFVTGNPGDGKTHLIKKLEPELRAAKVEICLDANEQDDRDLIKLIEQSIKRKVGLVMAINEGTLVTLLREAGDAAWASETRAQLLTPFVYRNNAKETESRVAVLDLNLRNNLASSVVRSAVGKLVELSAPCSGCPKARCDGYQNANKLSEAVVLERLTALLGLVAKSGHHATMRDLFGYLSFLMWGHKSCDAVKGSKDASTSYAENAFVGGEGPLFDAVRVFDPAAHTAPLLDDLLWRFAEPGSGWLLGTGDEKYEPGPLDVRREAFEARKRRAFFEHRQGETILKDAGSEVDKLLRELTDPERSAPGTLVRYLNRFFDRDEDTDVVLYLWVTHRYDARPTRYAAARWHVSVNELEVLVPRLRPDVAEAFPEFHPDHVILSRKGDPPDLGLRVDRILLAALIAAEQGLPSTFRSGEPGARIAAFYDRLARASANASQPSRVAEVRFVDIDTGANLSIGVDVNDARYVKK